jgi:hypothetical protein
MAWWSTNHGVRACVCVCVCCNVISAAPMGFAVLYYDIHCVVIWSSPCCTMIFTVLYWDIHVVDNMIFTVLYYDIHCVVLGYSHCCAMMLSAAPRACGIGWPVAGGMRAPWWPGAPGGTGRAIFPVVSRMYHAIPSIRGIYLLTRVIGWPIHPSNTYQTVHSNIDMMRIIIITIIVMVRHRRAKPEDVPQDAICKCSVQNVIQIISAPLIASPPKGCTPRGVL